MVTVLAAVVAMTFLGLSFAVFLALASRVFSARQDERVERVLASLPGVNCGACGLAGCRAYAEAVVQGEKVSLCTVGGKDVAEALAEIMGVEVSHGPTLRAIVHCQGGSSRCEQRFRYFGEQDCRAAHIISGGPKACIYGCLGFGTCADACPFDAITMSEERLPVIDSQKCTACGICVAVCPRGLISLLDANYKMYVGCSSRDAGRAVKDVCSVGCIACGLCAKKDPHGAIAIEGDLPVLDHEKAGGDFSVAAEACPMNCFVLEQAPAELALTA